MNKLTLLLIIGLLCIVPVFAADVQRTAPDYVMPGDSVDIVLKLVNVNKGIIMALEEQLPKPLRVQSWAITGIKEDRSQVKTRMKNNAWAWEFTPQKDTVTLTYTLAVPSTASGDAVLSAVWFDSDGFKKDEKTIVLGAAPVVVEESRETSLPNDIAPSNIVTGAAVSDALASKSWLALVFVSLALICGLVYYFYIRPQPKKRRR